MKYLIFGALVLVIGLLLSGFEIKIITEPAKAQAANYPVELANRLVRFYDFGSSAGLFKYEDEQYICYMMLGANSDDLDCKPRYPK